MAKLKRMTHEQHLEFAKLVRRINKETLDAFMECQKYWGKTSRICTKLRAAHNSIGSAKSLLDDEYHQVTTQDQFEKQGHVYYNPRNKDEHS